MVDVSRKEMRREEKRGDDVYEDVVYGLCGRVMLFVVVYEKVVVMWEGNVVCL